MEDGQDLEPPKKYINKNWQ